MPAPARPLVIHHIEGRRSERVAWLCEELGIPYELRFVSGDVMGSLVALEQAHVMRMAPVLEDGAIRLVESAAILEYILLRYGEGRLRPANDAPETADYLQWLHFAEGSGMFRGMIERMIFELAGDEPPPQIALIYVGGSRRVLAFAEEALAKHSHFAGEAFTAVTPLFHDDRRGLEDFPHERVRAQAFATPCSMRGKQKMHFWESFATWLK